ncbi:MAG TPA: hypothetical protein VMU59_07290 [Caulobacteraceae bacterium]|nr:hypothetical protein [Caulobacteraceae bacterium]
MSPPTPTRAPFNLLANLPSGLVEEQFDSLIERPGVRLERIVSNGQATPAGTWLSQAEAEWVLLLQGAAGLSFEDGGAGEPGGPAEIVLAPGDSLFISPGRRHRVDWTARDQITVWLALHLA